MSEPQPVYPTTCQQHRYYTLPSGKTGVHTCGKSPVTKVKKFTEPTLGFRFVMVSWKCDQHKEEQT